MQSHSEHSFGLKMPKSAEYAIYTYDHYDPGQFGTNKWQKYKTLENFDRALKEARVLLRSNQFQKIEIKQKYHDKKLQRFVSKTLKSYEHNKSSAHTMSVYGLVLGFIILGLFALMLY